MINDNTHKSSLSNIALRLFSIIPHSVMPERSFSILDWHHTKRQNRLNSFTLDAIAKIQTFYKAELNNNDETMDVGHIEEMLELVDEVRQSNDAADESRYGLGDATDFIQYVSDNHHVLRTKCEAETIGEDKAFDDEYNAKCDPLLNIKDRNFQQILADLGLIEEIQVITSEDHEFDEFDEDDDDNPSETSCKQDLEILE